MGEPSSLEWAIAAVVRAELAAALADVRASLAALAAVAAPTLLDLAEAHRRGLITSVATGRRLCASGEIPARRIGRRWMIDATLLRPASTDDIAALAHEARRPR